jgi:hypothetical protein
MAAVSLVGCADIFSSSFLNLVLPQPIPNPDGTVPSIRLDNAPGHVAVLFVNNTTFDNRVLDYIESTGTVLGDRSRLRPRVRARFRIVYANDTESTIEFIDGDAVIESTDPVGAGVNVPPELLAFELHNVVGVCDISRIEPVQVEIFLPTSLVTVRIEQADEVIVREIEQIDRPGFVLLEADTVDPSNNTVLLQNFDIREAPVLVNGVQCGAVVGFTVEGTLELPFVAVGGVTVPGFLDTDEASQAAVPGRFAFRTNLR